MRQIDLKDIQLEENRFKEIFGMIISYKDVGEGYPLFCLPAWGGSSALSLPLAYALKDKFRIIAIDFPGWGGHSTGMLMEPTVENYAKITESFIRSFELKSFSLLGYSLGGLISQIIVNNKNVIPDKVVLVSTLHTVENIFRKYPGLTMFRFIVDFPITARLFRRAVNWFFLRFFKTTSYYPKNKNTKVWKALIDDFYRADTKALFDVLFNLSKGDYLKKNKKLIDTLLIMGAKDQNFILQESLEIAWQIGLDPVIVKDADHNHYFFDINKSAELIADFLNG